MLSQLQWTDASSVSAALRQWLAGADPTSARWQRIASVAIEISDAPTLAVLRASLPASALDAVARARLLLAVARRGALDQVTWGADLAACLELLDAARDLQRWDGTAARAWAQLVSRLPTRRAVTTIERTLAPRDAAFVANLYLALRDIDADLGATEEALLERWLEAAPPYGSHRVTLATAAFRMDPPRGGVALRAALKDPPTTIRLEPSELRHLYADDPAILREHAEALRFDPDTLAAVLGEEGLLARLRDGVRGAGEPGHARAWTAHLTAAAEARPAIAQVRSRIKGGWRVAVVVDDDPDTLMFGFLARSRVGPDTDVGDVLAVRALEASARRNRLAVEPLGTVEPVDSRLLQTLGHGVPIEPRRADRELEILATWLPAAPLLDALLGDDAIPAAMRVDLRCAWCRLDPVRAAAWLTDRPADDAREAAAVAVLREHPVPDLASWALAQDRPRLLLAALRDEPSGLPDTPTIRARLVELTDPSWPARVRVRAAQRRVAWGDRTGADTLISIAAHDEIRERLSALWALVEVCPDAGVPTFERIVAHTDAIDSTARHAQLRLALHGLARAGHGTRVLQTILDRDDGAAFTAVLATLSGLPPLDPDPFWDRWPAIPAR